MDGGISPFENTSSCTLVHLGHGVIETGCRTVILPSFSLNLHLPYRPLSPSKPGCQLTIDMELRVYRNNLTSDVCQKVWPQLFEFELDRIEEDLQGTSKRPFPGLVNFVPAVAYHFCLNLPEALAF